VPRISLCSMLQSLRHSAPAEVQNEGSSHWSDFWETRFFRTCASMACIRSIFLIKHQEQNTLSELNGHIMPLPHTSCCFRLNETALGL